MGKYYDFTESGRQYGFNRTFIIDNKRRTVTYTLYFAGTKEWAALNEEFGEEDSKIMAETVNAVVKSLSEKGPITLEESTIELNKYEGSYPATV